MPPEPEQHSSSLNRQNYQILSELLGINRQETALSNYPSILGKHYDVSQRLPVTFQGEQIQLSFQIPAQEVHAPMETDPNAIIITGHKPTRDKPLLIIENLPQSLDTGEKPKGIFIAVYEDGYTEVITRTSDEPEGIKISREDRTELIQLITQTIQSQRLESNSS